MLNIVDGKAIFKNEINEYFITVSFEIVGKDGSWETFTMTEKKDIKTAYKNAVSDVRYLLRYGHNEELWE